MKSTIREIEKQADRKWKERKYQKDEDGRAILHMTVKNDDAFLSEFSESETPVIASQVAEFIEDRTYAIPPTEALTLRIHSDCIDEREEELYTQAIREYYLARYIANAEEIKKNRFWVIILGLLGVLVLTAEILYDYIVGNAIWTEVIDIVAWVLLWEATDIGLLATRDLRIKKKRLLAYLDMKVEYHRIGED